MTQSQHTPGEWTFRENEECYIIDSSDTKSGLIAEVHKWIMKDSDAETHANARLMSAAPDLLEACKMAKDVLERQGITLGDLGYAIQKAQGNQ